MPTGSINTMVASMDSFSSTEEYLQYVAGFMANNFGELDWLLRNLDSVNVKYLIAERIKTGTLNAGKVTIKSEYESGASIILDKTGMRINDGIHDVFIADAAGQVTMTGAKVQSAEEYPKVELSSEGNVFTAYVDEGNYVQIVPDSLGGAQIKFVNNGNEVTQKLFNSGVSGYVYMIQSDGGMELNAAGDILSNPGAGKYHRFGGWSEIYSNNEHTTLLSELNGIKSRIASLEARVTALGG